MARPTPSDGDAYRAYALLANAIHKTDRFMLLLSERELLAEAIWDELIAQGVQMLHHQAISWSENENDTDPE